MYAKNSKGAEFSLKLPSLWIPEVGTGGDSRQFIIHTFSYPVMPCMPCMPCPWLSCECRGAMHSEVSSDFKMTFQSDYSCPSPDVGYTKAKKWTRKFISIIFASTSKWMLAQQYKVFQCRVDSVQWAAM